jgi:hypothetical protein
MFFFTVIAVVFIIAWFVIPGSYVGDPWTSPANACINNLRRICVAKEEWALANPTKTNEVITIDDIRPYLQHDIDPEGHPYLKLDENGNLPKCPSGGIYTIGKLNVPPTCSIGTNAEQPHVLIP